MYLELLNKLQIFKLYLLCFFIDLSNGTWAPFFSNKFVFGNEKESMFLDTFLLKKKVTELALYC